MNVVVITLIKSKQTVVRGKQPPRKGTDWAQYSINTWKWWCIKNNAQLEILETNYGHLEDMAYTYQRWCTVPDLLKKYGANAKLAFVDADTMVKWDTPNFFNECPEDSLTVTTREDFLQWCDCSINRYQPLFPNIILTTKNYYNAGFVVFSKSQLNFVKEFKEFVENNKKRLLKIQLSGNVGTDQTPFNFILRKTGNKVYELPVTYNWLKAFNGVKAAEEIYQDSAYDFINKAYVWHFTMSYEFRDLIMLETWKRIAKNYS